VALDPGIARGRRPDELRHEGRGHQRVEMHVEAVEEPAQPGGEAALPLRAGQLAQAPRLGAEAGRRFRRRGGERGPVHPRKVSQDGHYFSLEKWGLSLFFSAEIAHNSGFPDPPRRTDMTPLTVIVLAAALGADKEAGLDDYLGNWDIMLLDTGTTFNACWWKVEKNDGAPAASLVWRWGSVVPAQKVEVSG